MQARCYPGRVPDALGIVWGDRTAGRFLRGEHTSFQAQGYMNGAVESGLRVVGEVALAAEESAVG